MGKKTTKKIFFEIVFFCIENPIEKLVHFVDFDEFSSFFACFSLEEPRLNWTVSDFKTTVLEGFYELCKFLEISIRRIDEVSVR